MDFETLCHFSKKKDTEIANLDVKCYVLNGAAFLRVGLVSTEKEGNKEIYIIIYKLTCFLPLMTFYFHSGSLFFGSCFLESNHNQSKIPKLQL